MSTLNNIYRKRQFTDSRTEQDIFTDCILEFARKNHNFISGQPQQEFRHIISKNIKLGKNLGLTGYDLCEFIKNETRRYFSQYNIYLY